ncbi:hypothetical protein [Brucella pseudogrignonensis]|uniref:hypothetical protein n=1 Tax=Brucella pseudogrignonensis TaxID=419475 RepID=UPI0038D024A1
MQAEIVHELLNTAPGIVLSRFYEIEESDPDLAERLLRASKEIHEIKLSFGVRDDELIAEINTTWCERVKDPESFIRSL